MKNTEATLYTEKGVLTGFVHHLEEERLADSERYIQQQHQTRHYTWNSVSPPAESPEGGNTTTVKKNIHSTC